MKVLVTGASGFIGGNLVRQLLCRDFEVKVLLRRESRKQGLDGLKVEVSYGDLRDRPSLNKALEGCEALFHVAASYAFWTPDPRSVYDTNVQGTRNVLEAVLDRGIRKAVYTSTEGTIGIEKGCVGNECTEENPSVSGHYKQSKFQAEKVAFDICRRGLPLVVVNPTMPIGPYDYKPTPTGQIVVDYLNRRMPAYVETGLNVIDVEDVAVGHILALEKGRIGERYILGNRNLSFREILGILESVTNIPAPRLKLPFWLVLGVARMDELWTGKVLKRRPKVTVAAAQTARHVRHFDCSKAIRELGLPQTPVEQAFEKAVGWFRENGYAS